MMGIKSCNQERKAESGVSGPGGLSGTALKTIAMVTMLTDHIGAVLIENGILHAYDWDYFEQVIHTEAGWNWYLFDIILRGIGRLAFPIFVFLLVEGFFHTRSRGKYAGNCLAFALLSEVPFDLANANPVGFSTGMADQNIYFALTLGLLMMMGLERFGSRPAAKAGIVILAAGTARLLHVDYEEVGILLIAVFYLYRTSVKRRNIYGGILMAAESLSLLGSAVLALLPISMYNGRRGGGRLLAGYGKYLFYWFYPVHLTALYLIARCLQVGPLL